MLTSTDWNSQHPAGEGKQLNLQKDLTAGVWAGSTPPTEGQSEDSKDAKSAVLGFPAVKSCACAYQGTALEANSPAEFSSMDWNPEPSTPAFPASTNSPEEPAGNRNFVVDHCHAADREKLIQ
ncbi:hypothetical protein TURU_141780 [Turdus rufiventris]|nr:hypothetical protein TURU_141780 [Turdus rufiventris]